MSGNVLITGGLGNLGSWITKYFLKQNFNVYVLTRNTNDNISLPGTNIIEVDITDIAMLREMLNFGIDFCVHAASYNEHFEDNYPQQALNINSLGTRNLLEVLSTNSLKHFIYLSTFHVYGRTSGNIVEQTEACPINDYASTHLFAEIYVKQFGITSNIPYSILRLTNSYGAPVDAYTNKWYLIVNALVKSAYETGKIVLQSNGNIEKDFIYMGDVSDAIHKLTYIVPKNEIYNLSYGQSLALIDVAKIIKSSLLSKFSKDITIEINNHDKRNYGNLKVCNKKLAEVIDFTPKDVLEHEVIKIVDVLSLRQKVDSRA